MFSGHSRFAAPSACLCAVLLVCGCKNSAPGMDDATLTRTGQAQINTDGSLSGQPVTVAVAGGVATLSGSVLNDAQKTIAARDIAGIAGIKQVQNGLTIGAPPQVSATVSAPLPAPIPVPPAPIPAPAAPLPAPQKIPLGGPTRAELAAQAREEARQRKAEQTFNNQHQPAPIERPEQAYNPPPAPVAAPPPPPPPPQPVFRSVTVPSGTTIPVRVTQTLDSATTQEGDTFSGVVASDVMIDGVTVISGGSTVSGHVDTVHEAAHFKGASLLTVSLATVSHRGDRTPITTDPYSVEGKGRGKNTAEKVGGGAAVGAILGGIFGGGKGAAIGAAAGGGVGAGANAVTKGEQVQIPSETIVRFHLSAPLTVRVRTDQGTPRNGDSLQPRNY